ncbi:MAG: rRNA processing protein RimM [Chloroflexota bacterium]|jgi:16S rRNA processing protein RimM|nr:rRNA processing protein RimM [Chloroflexota bacterium]
MTESRPRADAETDAPVTESAIQTPVGPTTAGPAESEALASTGSRLVVALVRGIHGLRGAVRIEILTDRPEERYAVGKVLYREGSDEPLTISWSSAVGDGPGWRVQFAEVRDRSAAEDLKNAYLEVDAGPEAALPRGAYFWHEVVGTPVTSTDGTLLGTVRDIYRSGGAEIYIVDGGDYGEFDVPAVRDFIRIFAPRRGEIVVDTEALDLAPPKRRRAADDPDRPRAPRRKPGPRPRKAAPQPTGLDGSAGPDDADRPNPFDVLAD